MSSNLFDPLLKKLEPYSIKNIHDLLEFICDCNNNDTIMCHKVCSLINSLDVIQLIDKIIQIRPGFILNLFGFDIMTFDDATKAFSNTLIYSMNVDDLTVDEMKARVSEMSNIPFIVSECPECKRLLSDDEVRHVYDRCISVVKEYLTSGQLGQFVEKVKPLMTSTIEAYKKNDDITDIHLRSKSNIKLDMEVIRKIVDIIPNITEDSIITIRKMIDFLEDLLMKSYE